MLAKKVAVASAAIAVILLVIEHFLTHGRDLNPVHHWLSEYVLSDSGVARWMMRLAFLALAAAALCVAIDCRERIVRVLFTGSAAGLAAMVFFESDPNDGLARAWWPSTAGHVHQSLLTIAIAAALAGIGLRLFHFERGRRLRLEKVLFGLAASASLVQLVLTAVSDGRHEMTRFGGVTERIVVLALLGWVACYRFRKPAST